MINGLLLAKSQILVRFKIIEKSGLYGIINSIKEVFSQAKKHFILKAMTGKHVAKSFEKFKKATRKAIFYSFYVKYLSIYNLHSRNYSE